MKYHTMQNQVSNCFCMCQIHHIRLSLSGYYIKILAPITEKEFPVKNQEWSISAFVLAWRQFLRPDDVKGIFDHMREPNP